MVRDLIRELQSVHDGINTEQCLPENALDRLGVVKRDLDRVITAFRDDWHRRLTDLETRVAELEHNQ